MLSRQPIQVLVATLLILLLQACGSSSSTTQQTQESNQTESTTQVEQNQTIQENNLTELNETNETNITTLPLEEKYKLAFIDSPVVNLTYACGAKVAQTGSEGNLSCAEFPITFSAIGVEIGTLDVMTDDAKVFPQDLVGVGRYSTSNSEVRKIASFLQSLDDDGDVSEYIVITEPDSIQSKTGVLNKQERPLKLKEMTVSEMLELLRSYGITPVSIYQAEENLRLYGLGIAPYVSPVPTPTPVPIPTPVPTPAPDTTPPVVTLNGDVNVSIYLNQTYTELNATATDDIDGNVSASIVITGTVDNSVLGENNITYTATDSAGNEGNATRTVNVVSILKKTGQTTSYDENGNVVADGTQRDDGYYQKRTTPSYTRDNINETVTDNVTGLMWQDDTQVSSVQKQWLTDANYNTCSNDKTDPACFDTTGDTATTYCDELVMGGYEDWRLPTSVELEGIVDDGKRNPSIDTTKFQHIRSSDYWSSTSIVGHENYAWVVFFYYGYVNGYNKDNSYFVRCVRDGQ